MYLLYYNIIYSYQRTEESKAGEGCKKYKTVVFNYYYLLFFINYLFTSYISTVIT